MPLGDRHPPISRLAAARGKLSHYQKSHFSFTQNSETPSCPQTGPTSHQGARWSWLRRGSPLPRHPPRPEQNADTESHLIHLSIKCRVCQKELLIFLRARIAVIGLHSCPLR